MMWSLRSLTSPYSHFSVTMKSPLWLSRITHGFILQGTDNNRLYSGNHVTIISKISPRTADWWAGLEKRKYFSSHSRSYLLNPYPFDVSRVIIYLYYILFSHSSKPCNTHRDQKPQNTLWRQFWRDLQMPGVCTDVWRSRVCPLVLYGTTFHIIKLLLALLIFEINILFNRRSLMPKI